MASKVPKMHVLIVGGGIGGLMLGLMLERAGIDYQILERSPELRPLGSAISLNGTVLRLFEQLGLLEDLLKISKAAGRLHLVKEDLETQGHIDLEHFRERYGYHSIVFGRPDFFQMLISHIPAKKILMGKRILSSSQTELGVIVRCSDGSAYHGDILVGADGAHSSIRQCMHKTLKEQGLLPKSDSEKLKFDQNCVVGITNELDPEKFPILKEELCELYGVIGKKNPYTIWLVPIVGNRFAWSIGGRVLDSEAGQEDIRSFSFAEWWPELATDVCDLVRDYTLPDFKIPYHQNEHYKNTFLGDEDIHGGHPTSDETSLSDDESYRSGIPSDSSPMSSSASSTCGSDHPANYRNRKFSHLSAPTSPGIQFRGNSTPPLSPFGPSSATAHAQGMSQKRKSSPAKPGTVAEIIDATNTERISKVMLESKLFKVWHHERTVLLGDSCHKLLPFAGQGATQAILDGISLANALYDMNSTSIEDITKAFKRYSSERMPIARNAVAGSRSFSKLLNIQGRLSEFICRISFNHVPHWILRFATDKLHLHRPQLSYLPMVPDRGTAKAYKQEYSPRYLAQLDEERQAQLEQKYNATHTNTLIEAMTAPSESRHEDQDDLDYKFKHHFEPQSQSRRSSVSRESESGKKMSSRSLIPPPLPLQAPPRHHPTVYLPHRSEDTIGAITSSRSSSAYSSPSSSTYSLSSAAYPDELGPQSRARRHTVTQNGRPQSTSPRVISRKASFPQPLTMPLPYETHNHSPLRSPDAAGVSSQNRFYEKTPSTPPLSPRFHTVPIMTPHSRTKSLQRDDSLVEEIRALERTTAMMKERAALREQRSWDQIKHATRK